MKPSSRIASLIALNCLLLSLPGWSATVEVSLKEKVVLSTSQYRLGDVADVTSIDATRLANALSRVIIGKTPKVQLTARINRSAINARLIAVLPEARNKIVWKGRQTIVVESQAVVYSGERLAQAARQHLVDILKIQHDDFQVETVGIPRDVMLPPGGIKVAPREGENRVVGKRHCVWLDITIGDQIVHSRPVWFSVSIFEPALIARTHIARGEQPGIANIQKQYVDITHARGNVVIDIAEVSGMAAADSGGRLQS